MLEDDCIFSERVQSFIASEKWIPKGVKLCQLSHSGQSGDRVLIERRKYDLRYGGSELVRVIKPHYIGAVAYFIHRDVAKLALEATRQLEAPIDELLFSLKYPIGKKYAGWMVNPYPIRPDMIVESTIGHEKAKGFGKPYTFVQVLRKFSSRIYIYIYTENSTEQRTR